MSPARIDAGAVRDGGGGGGGGGARSAITVLAIVVVALAMVLLTRSRPSVQPFDPRSARPDGANALVLLLGEYGADVSISARVPTSATDRVLVLSDRLSATQRTDLLDYVEAGGVAVVADPTSSLPGASLRTATELTAARIGFATGTADAELEANVVRGACNVPVLQGLRGLWAPNGVLFERPEGSLQCFSDPDQAGDVTSNQTFVVTRQQGAGLIVGLGDNTPFTNSALRFADNSGLAVALLAPEPGTSVRIVLGSGARPAPADIGSGDDTLFDLVRPGVWMALTQLALAFVVFATSRAVRPAGVARERTATPIAGNELVLATANLMQRAGHHQRAGWLIRSELYHDLCRAFSAPNGVAIERLAEVVAQRSAVSRDELSEVLQREVTTAPALLALTAQVHAIRQLGLLQTVAQPVTPSEQS